MEIFEDILLKKFEKYIFNNYEIINYNNYVYETLDEIIILADHNLYYEAIEYLVEFKNKNNKIGVLFLIGRDTPHLFAQFLCEKNNVVLIAHKEVPF